jgi:hypothetical protein
MIHMEVQLLKKHTMCFVIVIHKNLRMTTTISERACFIFVFIFFFFFLYIKFLLQLEEVHTRCNCKSMLCYRFYSLPSVYVFAFRFVFLKSLDRSVNDTSFTTHKCHNRIFRDGYLVVRSRPLCHLKVL